jgi:integrase
VHRQYAALRSFFQYAVDAELVVRNPASRLRLPQAEEVVRPSLTADQLESLAAELGDVQGAFMWCGAVLGLRWAEAAGLTVSSLDMLGGTVTVRAQLGRDGQLALPKTKGSARTLAAPSWLIEELAGILRERGLTGADRDSLVFATEAGTGLSYPNWRVRVWQPATKAAGVAGLRYHDLRSIAASALVASGVDLRTAMHRLGHTTPAMTLAVYARVAEDRDREAADAVAGRVAPSRPLRIPSERLGQGLPEGA